MFQTGTTAQSPIRWKFVILQFVRGVERHPRYGLLLAFVLTAVVALVHPTAGMILGATLVLGGIPLLWLSRSRRIYVLIGVLLFLTILRPLPDVGNAWIYDRLLDAGWFLVVTVILAYRIVIKRNRPRVWSASYWLLAGTVVLMLALPVGSLLGQPVILRDFFELYRGPYYFLVLLLATQVSWSDENLLEFLHKPLLIALFFTFAVSIMQGLGDWGESFVSNMYTPKFAEPFYDAFSNAVGRRESGFFFLINAGTFANPNWYGVSLGIMVPFLMAGLFATGHRRLRTAIWVSAVVAFLMIVIAGSRTGLFMGTMAAFGYFGLWLLEAWKRPSVAHVAVGRVGRWAPMLLLMMVVTLLILASALRGDRYHGTVVALARGIGLEVESVVQDEVADSLMEEEPSGLVEELRNLKIGRYTNPSAARKIEGATNLIKEAWHRSPVVGLGPSKKVGNVLGDTQYSVVFYRYGTVGTLVWFGFWGAVMWHTFRRWRRATTPLQAGMLRAVLATVPAFILAGVGGAFFDARQIATLFLLLIGVAVSCRGKSDEQTT